MLYVYQYDKTGSCHEVGCWRLKKEFIPVGAYVLLSTEWHSIEMLYGAPEPVAAPPQGCDSYTTDYSSSWPGYDADYANQGYYNAPVDNRSSYPPAQSYLQPEVYPRAVLTGVGVPPIEVKSKANTGQSPALAGLRSASPVRAGINPAFWVIPRQLTRQLQRPPPISLVCCLNDEFW